MRVAIIFLCILLLSSCSGSPTYAPVSDLNGSERIPKSGMHRVTANETLYSIAWRYGLDYRKLASWNHINEPYTIQKDQLIMLRANHVAIHRSSPVLAKQAPVTFVRITPREKEPDYSVTGWKWPTHGRILNRFSVTNKGVNIAGRQGEAIYAVSGGKVVYSGNGLRGYGNLIIIKHNNLYLSAYAHCRLSLVKDGDWVKRGQKIAEMGKTGSDKVMLHFEIRRAGKPVDPLSFYHTSANFG